MGVRIQAPQSNDPGTPLEKLSELDAERGETRAGLGAATALGPELGQLARRQFPAKVGMARDVHGFPDGRAVHRLRGG